MKVHYDTITDSAYIELSDEQPDGVIEVDAGINIDVTHANHIVGIEILEVSNRMSLKSLFTVEYDTPIAEHGS